MYEEVVLVYLMFNIDIEIGILLVIGNIGICWVDID